MATSGPRVAGNGFFGRVRIILEMIKFEHTLFALPFALISMLIAARNLPHGLPGTRVIGWILGAMVGGRSAAMAFNRLVDARYDKANPRTRTRALPAGILSTTQVAVFTLAAMALFEYAAYQINMVCFLLSPLALLAILGYSYTKRFTPLSHIALGFGIGLAPIGAWLAVRESLDAAPILFGMAVMFWIGGFDTIYALQDVKFDSRAGLHSLPQRFGKARALLLARIMHLVMLACLISAGYLAGLHWLYYVGVGFASCLIAYEHSIVKPNDLSRVNLAFFTLNGWVSVALFLFVVLDRILNG